jgi:acetolactate synthase-1/2/3 large subunit
MLNADNSVASYLAEKLPDYGVTHVFELTGGMVTLILDAMHRNRRLTVISMHHEQAAGFAAEGFTRVANRTAIAMGTSGPGATNLLTAMASCYFDSIPVLFITGQVNRSEMRKQGRGRQGGFQETDIVSMAQPIVKKAFQVLDAGVFPELLDEAFKTAHSGRPGPVLLDIPMDIQQSYLTGDDGGLSARKIKVASTRTDDFLNCLSKALKSSQRPMIIAGGGVRSANATSTLASCASAWGIPVVQTLMGLDTLQALHPMRVGFMGSYGNRWANYGVAEADLLIVLGSRLDIRQTGSDVEGFKGSRRIFHIDIDEGELNNHVTGCETITADLGPFLIQAQSQLNLGESEWVKWHSELLRAKERWPDTKENVPLQGINPNVAVHQISNLWSDVGVFVTDVGQHQMWVAQSIQLRPTQRLLTSGGLGSMGFGLPAAIGASLASPNTAVCVIAGDGGLQCNMQEFQTIFRLGLPIRIVVFDNGCHGMVRQFQESYLDSRYFSSKWGYSAPDFTKIAAAYGIPSMNVKSHGELESALKSPEFMGNGPGLLRIEISSSLNVFPKMAFGQPFGSMEPDVHSIAMEST